MNEHEQAGQLAAKGLGRRKIIDQRALGGAIPHIPDARHSLVRLLTQLGIGLNKRQIIAPDGRAR